MDKQTPLLCGTSKNVPGEGKKYNSMSNVNTPWTVEVNQYSGDTKLLAEIHGINVKMATSTAAVYRSR